MDLPRELRFPSGIMVLEYGKAVQESVYEQLRVVREGQLRIIFTHDLKVNWTILCACRCPICSKNLMTLSMHFRFCLGNFVLDDMKNFFHGEWLHHRYVLKLFAISH